MLGGGVYITQNKKLPGSYINFVNATRVTSTVGERGTVAIAMKFGDNHIGEVIELTRNDFVQNCETIFGIKYGDEDAIALREIFCHANKVYLYNRGTDKTVAEACAALEPYEFNVLCAYTQEDEETSAYITQVKTWRDEMGKKCQVVVYDQTNPDHEGVVNVGATQNEYGDCFLVIAWISGAMAGCNVNESCTNMLYDGELNIKIEYTQSQLEQYIENGQVVFHNVYGEVRVLEDINSLKSTTVDKGEDFKNNQTIRVVDQIANDIAKLFNTKYLGKIPNNASGRVSLWADIVAHHRELERIQAIENFDPTLLTVEQGATKKSVVVNDVITVTNCMSQLYMTVVVQ